MLLIWSDPRPNPHHATRMFCLCGVNTIQLYLQETVLLGNILFGVIISFVFKLLWLMYMYNTPVTIVVIHMHQDIIRKIFEMTVNCLLSFISAANWKWFAMSREILKGFSYHMMVGEHISHRVIRLHEQAGAQAARPAGDGRIARAISYLERQVFIRRQWCTVHKELAVSTRNCW